MRKLAIGVILVLITTSFAIAQQNRSVTCSGILVDFQTTPQADFPTAIIYDAEGGFACLIDRGRAGHDPLRPCTAGRSCRLIGTYKSKVGIPFAGQTFIIDRWLSLDLPPEVAVTLSPKKSVPPIIGTPNAVPAVSTLVSLQQEGGTYTVPVLINNAITLNFVLDSGAADVSIPADVVMTLFRTSTLRDTDFTGSQTYRLADGSTIPSRTFKIRSLTVGNKVVENVIGSIAPVAGSLLLGQSFLSRFRAWSIDNAKQSLLLEW